MKSLVVYDSAFGNTAKVAVAIHDALAEHGDASLKLIADIAESDLADLDLLVIGSPTQGGRPTEPTQQFMTSLPKPLLDRVKIAVFDTRMEEDVQKLGLRMLMKTIGYASPKMAQTLRKRLAAVVVEPAGFIVNDKEGPIKNGELERAGEWAAQLAK